MCRRLDNFLLFIRSFFKCWRKRRLRGREWDSQFVDFLSIRCGSIRRSIFRLSGCQRECEKQGKATTNTKKTLIQVWSGPRPRIRKLLYFVSFAFSLHLYILYSDSLCTQSIHHPHSALQLQIRIFIVYIIVFVPSSPRRIILINILSCFALSPLRRRRLRFHLHFPLFQFIIADVVIARDCVSMQVR